MPKFILIWVFTFMLSMAPQIVHAQHNITLKGVIIDENNKENLAFANVTIDQGEAGGTSTNEKGQFRMRIPKGAHELQITYLGYKDTVIRLVTLRDTSITVSMVASSVNLNELVVSEEAYYGEKKIKSTQMSAIKIDRKQIQMLPNIAGEQDIIKVVQLLPGVSKGVEGAGDFFVRGGDADQNLLLLDGATIYNSGHLFGFVSVFNPDVIGEANFIKGSFPATYGGRLSSVLDIKTRKKMPDKTEIEGSVGIISSRLTIREPLMKKKMAVMVSARRTYIDQVLDKMKSDIAVPYYFYDLNSKIDFQADDKNSFFVSGYLGADILDYQRSNRDNGSAFKANFNIDNNSQSVGWKHIFSDRVIHNLLLSRTAYNYDIFNSFRDNQIVTTSGIEDYTANYTIKKILSNQGNYSFGSSLQSHTIQPIKISTDGLVSTFLPSSRSNTLAFTEGSVYGHLELNLTPKLRLNLGHRQSYAITQKKFYTGFEPRISWRYLLSEQSSLKLGYSRMTQYMHRVSSSAITLPVDLWYGVTKDIVPQTADQFAIGYSLSIPKSKIIFESEVYYKDLNNITEYEEGTNLLLNSEFESALLQGKGNSYGIETMIKKESKKWTTSLNYTLSWSNRQFDQLNEGKMFPAKYDRRHNIAMTGIYELSKRFSFSLVWEFISGSKFTAITGQYSIFNPSNSGINVLYLYSDRNEVSLSNTHRMDALLIWRPGKLDKKYKSEWHLGVYNVYNRATPISVNITENGSGGFKYEQPGVFGTLPTLSYHFKF